MIITSILFNCGMVPHNPVRDESKFQKEQEKFTGDRAINGYCVFNTILALKILFDWHKVGEKTWESFCLPWIFKKFLLCIQYCISNISHH